MTNLAKKAMDDQIAALRASGRNAAADRLVQRVADAERPGAGYWYEHDNGELIFKPALVVDTGGGPREYFASPFVKRWWKGFADDEPQKAEDKRG